MLHLIYGTDRNRVLKKSKDIIDVIFKSDKNALLFKFTENDFEIAKIEELIGSQPLFSKKVVVVCDGLLGAKDYQAFFSKKIGELSSSTNIFILREEKINKDILSLFSKKAETEEFITKEDSKKGYVGAREVKLREGYEGFNIFSFTDALGKKDKKGAWVLYHKALMAGFPPEELFWKAVWLFRNIILASSININHKDVITKLKISPFVYKKSKSFSINYDETKLKEIYASLLAIYDDIRAGDIEPDLAVEKFILNL